MLLWAAAIVAATSYPVDPIQNAPSGLKLAFHLGIYSAAHVAVFAVLTVLIAWWRIQTHQNAVRFAVLVAVLFGAVNEWHQQFVPGRHSDPADWLTDVIGALLGAAIAKALHRLLGSNQRESASPVTL